MSIGKCVWRVIADSSAIIALGIGIYLILIGFPNRENLTFDYQAILVGILAGLFTLIVGWNIYQMVDWGSRIQRAYDLNTELDNKLATLNTRTKEEINYLHNKADYNQALTYSFLSLQSLVSISVDKDEMIKQSLLHYGILAMQIYSNLPDCQKECSSALNIMIDGLESTPNIKISPDIATELILECGKIGNKENLKNFEKLITLISAYITN
ncbi:MAG: hypothetical protein K2L45_12380 [Muribaculaceae bacterium]|nr:hypothetical protein [Muribaculaceae bacterium]